MNEIVIIGNYLAIQLHGQPTPFLYSMKNTTFNIYSDRIELSELNDGKSIILKNDVDSGNWSNPIDGIFDWNTIAVFLATNTANFNAASGGSGAITEINYSNVLFVDPLNGNDSTALAGRFDKPFQSIFAATTLAAALGGSLNQRNLIFIRKGNYSGNVNLINWTDYYCEPGTIFTSSGNVRDNGLAVTSNWFGHAKFRKTSQALFITGNSTVNFEFDSISNDSGQCLRFEPPIGGECNVTVVGNSIFGTTNGVGYAIALRRKANVSLQIKNFIRAWHSVFDIRDNYDGRLVVNCPQIFLAANNIYGGNFKQCVISYSSTANARMIFNADFINEGASYLGGISGIITNWSATNGLIEVNGNIFAGETVGVYASGNTISGKISVNGNIFSNIQPIYVASNNSCLFKNGALIKPSVLFSSPTIRLIQNGKLFIQNATIYNAEIDGNLILAESSTNELNLYNCVGQTEGVLGFGITSLNVPIVKVHNTRVNKPLGATIIDLLTPSGYVFDPLVVTPKF